MPWVRAIALILVFLGAGSQAQATVTPFPVTPYTSSSTSGGGTIDFAGDTAGLSLSSTSGIDPNFHFFNLANGSTSGSVTEMVLFDVSVSPTTAPTGNQTTVLMMELLTINGTTPPSTPYLVPIAAAQTGLSGTNTIPALCGSGGIPAPNAGSNGSCRGSVLAGVNAYQGVQVANSTGNVGTIRIGFFPADICLMTSGSVPSPACSGTPAQLTYPTSPAGPLILAFKLHLVQESDGTTSPLPISMSTGDTDTNSVTANFHKDGMTLSCPGIVAHSQSPYFPGDGQIIVNSGAGNFTPGVYGTSNTSTINPILVVVGAEGALNPNPGSGGVTYSSYPIHAAIPQNTSAGVSGFLNSDKGGVSHSYQVGFAFEDSSGLVGLISDAQVLPIGPTTLNNCLISGVQTSTISGFLSKNNCFIVTGAFRSDSAPPILLLRRFRDRVLDSFSAGRALRDWYYHWSPQAGWWLLENPEYRLPVLRLLVPVQVLAWILLRPVLAALFVFFAGLLLFLCLMSTFRARRDVHC